MALKHGDLQDTMLKKISIDEFEPKTGDLSEVSTVGFFVKDRAAGNDLYRFINNSVVETRDVELTPNPTEDGYYMVFTELDRDANMNQKINHLLLDVQNIAGQMDWQFKTHLMDDFVPWDHREDYSDVFFTSSKDFMTVEQYTHKLQEQERLAEEKRVAGILEFFRTSSLENVVVEGDVITLEGHGNTAKFHIAGFGNASEVMTEVGISESAIEPVDMDLHKFNRMLGEMRAVKIAEHHVIFQPNNHTVMVVKAC